MSVMSAKSLSAKIKSFAKRGEKFKLEVHEALISCAFYAMKDGNITPFNDLLKAVGSTTRVKGITMWAETFAPVYVKAGKFEYSKAAAKALTVKNEDDFAEYEAAMREAPMWADMVPNEKVESIWDAGNYLENVIKTLRKHGVDSSVISEIEKAEMMVRVAATADEEANDEGEEQIRAAA